MNLFEILKRSLRFPSLVIGASTVFAGLAAAVIRQTITFMPVLLCFLFVWLAQLASNCYASLNERRSRKGYIAVEENSGNIDIKENKDLYTMLRDVAGSLALVALTIGIVLAGYTGTLAFLIGAVILILAYLNIQGPTPLNRTPFGPLLTYILFGPLGTIGVSLLQIDNADLTFFDRFDLAPALFIGCSFGFLAANCHLAINYVEYRQDIIAKRPSFATICGRAATRNLFLVNGFLMLGVFYWMVHILSFQYPLIDLIVPTISLIFNCFIWLRLRSYDGVRSLYNPYNLSLLNALFFSLVLCVLFSIIGTPAESVREINPL